MRFHALVPFALSCAAFAPAPLQAQFQPPSPEELRMTADPKAPGASAVYLYREETADDSLHFHTYYERIKILTEKGKEQATIRIPYDRGAFKVTGIKGRTIHADGTIVPLTTQPNDLMDLKSSGRQINQMVFTLPSVEVGSVLEYKLDLRYDDDMLYSPHWEIQQPLFVHKAHYFFKPMGSSQGSFPVNDRGDKLDRMMWTTTGVPLDALAHDRLGNFTIDLTDIPAIPNDDWMPPLNTLKWRVEFYYTNARSGAEFWDTEGKVWAKSVARFTNPTGALKKVVEQTVAPQDTEEQKARKLYAAVLKLENTRFTRRKSEAERKAEKLKSIKDAEDVWKQQSGTDDEIALLYVALARAAGLKVWPMRVTDRSRAFFDPRFLSVNQLDDYIAIVALDGKEVYLDPGQKTCPFGILNWVHAAASGLRLTEKGAALLTTPSETYKDAVEQRAADLTVDPTGAVDGSARFVLSGIHAIHWRQLALQNDQEELKKQFSESVHETFPDGLQADFDHFLGLDNIEASLVCVMKLSGNIGTSTGKRTFLPGLFFESHAKHPFVAQDQRSVPVDLRYPSMVQDVVTYHLPSGYTVVSLPASADTPWPGSAMLRITSSSSAGNSIKIVRSLAYNFTLLDAKAYADLHDFYKKVATADQQQIVLTRMPSSAGN